MDDDGDARPSSFREKYLFGRTLRDGDDDDEDAGDDSILTDPTVGFELPDVTVDLELGSSASPKKRQRRQDDAQHGLQEAHHSRNLPGMLAAGSPVVDMEELPVHDPVLMPLAPLHPSVTQAQLQQREHKPYASVFVPDTNIMTDADAVSPSQSRSASPQSGGCLLVPASPDVPDDDNEHQFGPDYFWDYCSEEENTTEVPSQDFAFLDDCEDTVELDDEEDVTQDAGKPKAQHVPLYSGSPVTQWESLTAMLAFMQSEHISGAGFGRLLSLIDLHLPKPNNFLKTNARLLKVLGAVDDPVQLHFFCSVCYGIRKDSSDLCDKCKEDRSVLYFITFPLEPQLRTMCSRPHFVQSLRYKDTRIKKNIENIEDIYDGTVYKEAEQHFSEGSLNITLMWNSDGIQVFKSNSFSLWPFYLVINELAPSERFKSENLLLAGLWGSVSKPHPNLYLLPIYKDLQGLTTGIEVQCYGEEETRQVKARVICGSCDAPARASFMNMKQHSGFYSCPVCKTKGEKPGDATVFPYDENLALRTLPEYNMHVEYAVQNRVIVKKSERNQELWCGIKGPTVLSAMVPNIFTSMAIDSLHCVYLGVMRQLLHLWTDKENKEEEFSVFPRLQVLNKRLRTLAPPHYLQRLPQTVDKLIYWKGTELRSFLFNLSLIVLSGVLDVAYYNHFSLFVKGVALLNSCSISEEDLVLAFLLLNQFVSQFAQLYGVENMTHNVHMTVHLERCVRSLGPLWSSTCFPFEDINGRLANFIHGTRHVGLQIYSNINIVTRLPIMVQELHEGRAKEYCDSILKKRYRLKIKEKVSPGVYCVGMLSTVSDAHSWILNVLTSQIFLTNTSNVLIFHRLLKNGILYVSKSYNRGQRVSSNVKYISGNSVVYGDIHCFIRVACSCAVQCTCGKQYFAIIKPKHVVAVEVQGVQMSHLVTEIPGDQAHKNCDVVQVADLLCVLFKTKVDGQIYYSEPLNDFELE